jgi:hypothetical protein
MILGSSLRRRVISVIGVAVTALSVSMLAPVPAHATLGPPSTVNIQLTKPWPGGGTILVGRVTGTIQFDDGNTAFKLSVTVCRQSSYTSPNVRISVNGVSGGVWTGEDNVRRPQACGGGHGLSFVIDGTFTRASVITRAGISIQGVFFDGSTATSVSGGQGFDNPYN